VKIPPRFDNARPFSSDLAPVQLGSLRLFTAETLRPRRHPAPAFYLPWPPLAPPLAAPPPCPAEPPEAAPPDAVEPPIEEEPVPTLDPVDEADTMAPE
jgi:hypothetical protein